jgi:hypothetical protein
LCRSAPANALAVDADEIDPIRHDLVAAGAVRDS